MALGCFLVLIFGFGENADDADDAVESVYEIKETVLERVSASESPSVPNVKQVDEDLAKRGFENLDITSHYDMDGMVSDEKSLERESSERHPIYGAMYAVDDDDIWMLYVVNGQFMASPIILDGVERPYGKQLIVVEDDYVTSYDAEANEFIVAVPDPAEVEIKKVERISADSLATLDLETVQ